MQDIAEIKETNNFQEANELLENDWVLLQIIQQKTDDDSNRVLYVLGLTRYQKRRNEQENIDHLSF